MRVSLSYTTVEVAAAGGIFDGISHYTYQLAEGLERRGSEVVRYSFTKPLARMNAGLRLSRPIVGGFEFLGSVGIVSRGAAKLFSPDADLFHSTDFKVVPAKCPVVATIWDAIPLVHPEWIAARSRFLAPFVIRRVAHFADRIICASEHSAHDLVRHFGISARAISVVPWGIDPNWLDPVPQAEVESTLRKYGLVPGFILTVGTIQPRKNIGRLLEAYAQLPISMRNDHRLVVVGREGWNSEREVAQLKELVSTGRAAWLNEGPSDRELRSIYQAAHVFVFPSLYEGFGIPLLEAFASSVPAITSKATSLPEVSAGAAREVDPLSVNEMSSAISALLRSSSEREERRRLGRTRAEHLSIGEAVGRTMEVYRSVVAGQ